MALRGRSQIRMKGLEFKIHTLHELEFKSLSLFRNLKQ